MVPAQVCLVYTLRVSVLLSLRRPLTPKIHHALSLIPESERNEAQLKRRGTSTMALPARSESDALTRGRADILVLTV